MKSKLQGTRNNLRTEGKDRSQLLLNFAPAEGDLRYRLRLLDQEQANIGFLFSDYPLQDNDITLYLIPVRQLLWLHTPKIFNYKPVLVYGPGHSLYRSFMAGCSDYLKEPWDEQELIARAERLIDGTAVDYPWGTVILKGATLTGPSGTTALSPALVSIFRILARYRGSQVRRDILSRLLWGEIRPASRGIDMHIVNLRRKMRRVLPEDVKTIILTGRSGGYMLR